MRRGLKLAAAGAVFLLTGHAAARSTLKQPNQHPKYSLEFEAHLALAPIDPPGGGTGEGWGPGLRLSFPLLDQGFAASINDTVALGVGLDWIFYDSDSHGFGAHCTRYQSAPNGTRVCVEINGETGDSTYFYIPVVMQYNLWFHERWSGFIEPGLAVYLRNDAAEDSDLGLSPVIQFGARFRFAKNAFLVARMGYPAFTLGASWVF